MSNMDFLLAELSTRATGTAWVHKRNFACALSYIYTVQVRKAMADASKQTGAGSIPAVSNRRRGSSLTRSINKARLKKSNFGPWLEKLS
jgi:hypothetical protein